MKKLIIGSSSDIALNLLKDYKDDEYIALSSNPQIENHLKIDLLDESSYPEINEEISGLVYFPGTINLKPFSSLKLNDFENDYNINVLGLIKILKHYNKKFTNGCSIVFISSVAASVGMPYHTSISLCKSAIEGLMRSLAAEWSPKIRVNCIAPSAVKTKLSQRLFRTEQQIDQMNKRHPLMRYGEKNDISNVIKFLLSKNSSWITGQVINIDGGLSTIKK